MHLANYGLVDAYPRDPQNSLYLSGNGLENFESAHARVEIGGLQGTVGDYPKSVAIFGPRSTEILPHTFPDPHPAEIQKPQTFPDPHPAEIKSSNVGTLGCRFISIIWNTS